MYKKIVYRAGRTVEVIKCYSHRYHPKGAKGPPQKKSPEKIAEANKKQQEKKLNRIINANFGEGDLYCTLTYEDGDHKPRNEDELKKDIQRFMRNLKGMYERRGFELKYIYTCSMGKRGNNPHFHTIVNAPMGYQGAVELVKRQWKRKDTTIEETVLATQGDKKRPIFDVEGEEPSLMKGFVKPEALYKDGEYRSLANYMIKNSGEIQKAEKEQKENKEGQTGSEEGKVVKFRRAYEHSRNLVVPQPEVTIIEAERFSEKVKAPKGYYIEPGSIRKGSDWSGWPYITYTLISMKPRGRTKPPDKGRRERRKCG